MKYISLIYPADGCNAFTGVNMLPPIAAIYLPMKICCRLWLQYVYGCKYVTAYGCNAFTSVNMPLPIAAIYLRMGICKINNILI